MNMKKIMAGVVASAMAVGTMAVAASADGELGVQTTTVSYKASTVASYNDEGGWFTQVMTGHYGMIDSITLTYEGPDGESGYLMMSTNWGVDAAVEANNVAWNDGGWTGANVETPESIEITEDNADDWTITMTVVMDMDAALDDWLNNLGYGEEAFYDDFVVVEFSNVGIIINYDEDDCTGGSASSDTDTDTASDAAGTGDTGAATADKGNADTGVEGVAAVAGVAILAAGAIIVAKKRK